MISDWESTALSTKHTVSCVSENLIYKISCKKPKCKDFVYIGQTKRRFCDRFNNHKSYVTEEKMEQICGAHFNEKGHTTFDMLPTIIEQVHPKGDDFLRLKREKMWIMRYEDFANKQSWKYSHELHTTHISWWSAKRLHTKFRPFRLFWTKRTRFSRNRLTNSICKVKFCKFQNFNRTLDTY